MKLYLLCVVVLLQWQSGCSQLCEDSNQRGFITVNTDLFLDLNNNLDPVCIRCLFGLGLNKNLYSDTTYLITSRNSNLSPSDSNVTFNGNGSVIVNVPGAVFDSSGDTVRCESAMAQAGGSVDFRYFITIEPLVFLDPVLSSVGGVDGIVNGIVEVVEGSDLTLRCDGNLNNTESLEPTYEWFNDSGNSLGEISITSPLVLVLNDILRDKSGEYVCLNTLSGNNEVRMTSVTVNVLYPPKVLSITPENTTLTEGYTLTFNCSYDANPAPNVTWGQNMSSIDTSDPNFNIVTEETYSLLEVAFANINYSGVYGCSIDNGIPPSDGSEGVNIIVQVAPGPVFDLTAPSNDITNDSIKLTWTLGFDGNADITGVNITYIATNNFDPPHSGFKMVSGQPTEYVIQDLQPLTTYEFTVVVLNSVSDEVGSSSEESVSAMTDPLVPDIPNIISLTPVSSTELNVNWIATTDTLTQTMIDRFDIEYYIDGENPTEPVIVINPPTVMTIITNLTKGTPYGVRVRAVNSAGPSEYSTPMTERTNIDPPTQVTELVITAFTFSLCISWEAPTDDGGQDISGYRIEIWDMSEYVIETFILVDTVGSNVLTYTIEELGNDTDYRVRVAADNTGNGEGDLGPYISVNATTNEPIPIDNEIVLTIDPDTLTAFTAPVSWTVNSENMMEFRLQVKLLDDDFDPDDFANFTGDVRYTIIKNLQPNTEYEIRLIRIEQSGCTRRTSPTVNFATIELEVEVSGPGNGTGNGTVTEGEEVVLICDLNTGGAPPDVQWMRVDGDIPDDAVIDGNRLTISDPQVEDSGDYTCSSRDASFTFSLLVNPLPPLPSPSPSPTSPTEETEEPFSLPTWAIAVIAAGAAICIVIFVIVLIVVLCCCCSKREQKSTARYDLSRQPKKGAGGMWLDEGGGGFTPIASNPPLYQEDVDSPVERGRTMTNDYVTATSFNTIESKGGGSKEQLTEESRSAFGGNKRTDV